MSHLNDLPRPRPSGRLRARALIAILATVLLGGLIAGTAATAQAATAPGLGTAGSFSVLAGSTVTNTGPTVATGDLGVSPGTAVTGFPPGLVNGTVYTAAAASGAKSDLVTAYDNAAGQACDTVLTGQDLGGLTLVPGTYCFSTSAQLTGDLTLDAQSDPNAVFVFQIGTTLTTSSGSTVSMINSGSSCNVFWQVGSSATLGTTTKFVGNILALTSITVNTHSSVAGRALARNAAVTMASSTVDRTCAAVAPPAPEPSPADGDDGSGTGIPGGPAGPDSPGGPGALPPGAGTPQTPAAPCRGFAPKRIKRAGVTRLLPANCVTNAGPPIIAVPVCVPRDVASRGELNYCVPIRKRNGAVSIRTFGYHLRVTVLWRAKAVDGYAPYRKLRTYLT